MIAMIVMIRTTTTATPFWLKNALQPSPCPLQSVVLPAYCGLAVLAAALARRGRGLLPGPARPDLQSPLLPP